MLAPHVYGKHGVVAGVTHVPLPSQADSGVNWLDADGHVAGLHGVPEPHRWQAPASHLPLVPHVDASWTAHRPDGSFAPVATFEQTPSIPATHDLQAVLQAESQQTPCAQKPLLHSAPAPQAAPRGLRPQLDDVQTLPVVQSADVVQDARQLVPLQT